MTELEIKLTQEIGVLKQSTLEMQQEIDALKGMEKIWNGILESSLDSIIVIQKNGKIDFINDIGAKRIGFTVQELIGKNIYEMFPPQVLQQRIDKIEQVFLNKMISSWESKQGSSYFQVTIYPINHGNKAAIVAKDITELKLTEESEQNKRARLQTLIETIPDLIWLKDTEGKYVNCNHKFERFFGASESAIKGKTEYDFLPNEQANSLREYAEKALGLNEPFISQEWITYANDGHREFVEIINTPFIDNNGILKGVMGIARDVTAYKQAEELLLKTNYDLKIAKEKAEGSEQKLKVKNDEYEALIEELRQNNEELFNAKDKIEESEKKFHDAIDFQPIPISIAKGNNIQIINQQFIKIFGYTIEDISTISEWIEKAYPNLEYRKSSTEIWDKDIQQAIANNSSTPTREYLVTCKDGKQKWIALTARIIDDLSIVIFDDITLRKIAEQNLIDSEERYHSLYDSMMDAFVVVDNDHKIIECNKVYLQMMGYSADELFKLTYKDITPIKWHQIEKNILENQVLTKGYSSTYEKEYKKKDGTIFPVELRTYLIHGKSGERSGMWAIVRDITERKNTELELERYRYHLEERIKERTKALDESEKKFRLLFEISPDEIVISTKDGSLVDCNEAVLKFHHLDKKTDFINMKSIQPYANPEDRAIVVDELNNHGFIRNMELRLKNIEGEIHTFLASMEKMPNENIIAWYRNIDERKQFETELQKAKSEAEEANHAKSEFLSNMSHELRTPLNAILGFSKLLRFQKNITEPQKEQLTTVHQCGEHLLSLINDILDLSKIEAQKLDLVNSEVNLPVVLHTIFNINKVKADEKDLEYELMKNVSLPNYVFGDERKLKQIMLNLINNAIKFTDEGKIAIRVDYSDSDNMFVFEVEDTGSGIPKEKQAEIFEPFIQHTDNKQFTEGSGLGLSITKKLVEMMRGRITLKSEQGKGSVFRAEIPLQKIDETLDKTEEIYLQITGYQGERRKILVVDDNQTNLALLVSLLKPIDFVIEFAENGQIALQRMVNFKPDLILLDYRMPVMDGIEFAKKIKQNNEFLNIKIIGISATLHQKELKRQFYDLCDDFTPKPVDTDLLLRKMKEILKLEWIIENNSVENEKQKDEQLILPDKNIIQSIVEYAEIGDYNSIREMLEQLAATHSGYGNFCQLILKHVRNYDKKGIFQLIKQFETRT